MAGDIAGPARLRWGEMKVAGAAGLYAAYSIFGFMRFARRFFSPSVLF